MSYDQWKTASPYDDMDDEISNELIQEYMEDYDSPYAYYRCVYKYTACGPTVGFELKYTSEPPSNMDESGPGGGGFEQDMTITLYCDDLRQLGTWEDMDKNGILVTGLSFGSIVEGVDQCTETQFVQWDDLAGEQEYQKQIEAITDAIVSVNDEADRIWMDTHGCERCSELSNHIGIWQSPTEGWDSITPVHLDCNKCNGEGVPI